MVPAKNLLRRHYDTYGGGFADFLQEEEKIYSAHNHSSSSLMISPMAAGEADQELEQETTSSSSSSSSISRNVSKGAAAADDGCAWLQLGIGSSSTTSAATATTTTTTTLSLGLDLDLDLFSNKQQQEQQTLQQPAQTFLPSSSHYGFGSSYNSGGQWGSYWSTTPSTAFPLPLPLPPQPQLQYCTNYFPQYVGSSTTTTSELKVIDPPTTRRQVAGVWFLLQAAENQQGREPLLPQISKSYLRIKDGRMTVRLLMKYLVKKLRLHDESEMEISCRGQVLLPYLTLQHVRDNIWCLGKAVAFLSDSPSDHVMTLQYGRSSSC